MDTIEEITQTRVDCYEHDGRVFISLTLSFTNKIFDNETSPRKKKWRKKNIIVVSLKIK